MKRIIAAAFFLIFASSAVAGEATCRDYARVKEEDRSLFNGYIYGYVVAKIGDRGVAEVNTAAARVKQLADNYCPTHPDDRLVEAIASFTTVASKYGSNSETTPSFWDTHKNCEELALKLTYPRKLNECKGQTEECKNLTNSWLNEAARSKKDCLLKKLGQ
jgi:HdeA/HdeB family